MVQAGGLLLELGFLGFSIPCTPYPVLLFPLMELAVLSFAVFIAEEQDVKPFAEHGYNLPAVSVIFFYIFK
jgi:hypothetical protein